MPSRDGFLITIIPQSSWRSSNQVRLLTAWVRATYSASVVERVTDNCFRLDHPTRHPQWKAITLVSVCFRARGAPDFSGPHEKFPPYTALRGGVGKGTKLAERGRVGRDRALFWAPLQFPIPVPCIFLMVPNVFFTVVMVLFTHYADSRRILIS